MNKFSIVGKTGTDITSRVGKVIVYIVRLIIHVVVLVELVRSGSKDTRIWSEGTAA